MNPYSILDLPPNFTPEQLKSAYRREASKAHPDRKGGSPERMQAVNEANDILRDPERRAHFDATGESTLGATPEVQARQVLMQLMQSLLTVEGINIITETHNRLLEGERNMRAQIKRADTAIRVMLARRAKMRSSGKLNLVHMLIDESVAILRANIEEGERMLERGKLMTQILREHESEEVAHMPQGFHNFGNGNDLMAKMSQEFARQRPDGPTAPPEPKPSRDKIDPPRPKGPARGSWKY